MSKTIYLFKDDKFFLFEDEAPPIYSEKRVLYLCFKDFPDYEDFDLFLNFLRKMGVVGNCDAVEGPYSIICHATYLDTGEYMLLFFFEDDGCGIRFNLKQRKLAQAIMNKCRELKPNDADACYKIYDDKDDYDKAVEFCEKAIELKPDDAEAYCNMGIAYANVGDYDKAIECFKKAIELKPDFAEACCNMGNAYCSKHADKDDYYEAVESCEKAIDKDDYDKAIEYYRKAIELKPDFAKAYNNMGIAYYGKQDYDKAIEFYKKAIELKLDFAGAYCNIGNAYECKYDYAKATEYYKKASEL